MLHLWRDEVKESVSEMSDFIRLSVRSIIVGTIAGMLIAATIAVEIYYPMAFLTTYKALLCTGFGAALGVALFYTFVLPALEHHFG